MTVHKQILPKPARPEGRPTPAPRAGSRAPAPLAPEFVTRCKESLADPRPSITSDELRDHFQRRFEADLKRDS